MPATASACAEPLVQEPSNRQRLSRHMWTIFVPASLYPLFPLAGPFGYLPCLSAPYTSDYLPHITRRQAQASSAVPDTDDSRELVARSLLELAKDPKSAGLTIDLMNGSNDLAAEIKKVVEAQTDAWTG